MASSVCAFIWNWEISFCWLIVFPWLAWRPKKMDSDQYLVVDFQTRVIISSLATQGRRAAREYVTLYALQYSDNGMNWFYYTDQNKIIMVVILK